MELVFPNKCVSYETFINDLAIALTPRLAKAIANPRGTISQRCAYRRFGEGNVKSWVKKGALKPFSKRRGLVEYRVSDLEQLHNREQDYF